MARAIWTMYAGHNPVACAEMAEKSRLEADRCLRGCEQWINAKRSDGLIISDEEIDAMRRGSLPRSSSYQYASDWRDAQKELKKAKEYEELSKKPKTDPTVSVHVRDSYEIKDKLKAAGYLYADKEWYKQGMTMEQAKNEHAYLVSIGVVDHKR